MNNSNLSKKSKTSKKPHRHQLQAKSMNLEMSKARGFLKGMDTTIIREPDREI